MKRVFCAGLVAVSLLGISCDRSQFAKVNKSASSGTGVGATSFTGLACNSDKCYGSTVDGGAINGGTSCAGNCSDNRGNYCFGTDCSGTADANTVCVGTGCAVQSAGTACLGRDCEGKGHANQQFCYGLNCSNADGPLNGTEQGTYCYGSDCSGLQGSQTMCQGPKCREPNANITYCFGLTCSGKNNDNTTCLGYDCEGYDGKRTVCVGSGCSEGTAKGAKVVEKTYSYIVPKTSKKLDIILAVDDSNSMLADNQRMASRLEPFVTDLKSAGIDWQMCTALTSPDPDGDVDTLTPCTTASQTNCLKFYWGNSVCWIDGRDKCEAQGDWVLNPDDLNLTQTFKDTITNIGAGWAYTDDERAIKSVAEHIRNRATNGCYRDGAALAVIALSDEDERSVGGRSSSASATSYGGDYDSTYGAALTNDDKPDTLKSLVSSAFGTDKLFSFHSVIVKPEDLNCKVAQDAEGSLSHFGYIYKEMSEKTSGVVASICSEDYGPTLRAVRNVIKNSLNSVQLGCAPVDQPAVSVSPAVADLQYTSSGTAVNFTPALPEDTEVTIKYTCLYSRSIASDTEPVRVLTSEQLNKLADSKSREPATPIERRAPWWVYTLMVVALLSVVFYAWLEMHKRGGAR